MQDQRVEQIIGTLLRAGVIAAAAVVTLGGAAFLWRHGFEPPHYAAFHGVPAELRSLGPIVGRSLAGRSQAIIQLGLVLLIATPVARVAFSVAAFALERDWLYVGITLAVLGILIFSLAGGV